MNTQDQNIGRCELCGTVDHHLVDGACNQCNELYELIHNEHACNDNYTLRIVVKNDPVLNAKAYREAYSIEVAA